MGRTIYSFRYRLTFITDEGHQPSPWVYGEHSYAPVIPPYRHGRRGTQAAYQLILDQAFEACAREGAAYPTVEIIRILRRPGAFWFATWFSDPLEKRAAVNIPDHAWCRDLSEEEIRRTIAVIR